MAKDRIMKFYTLIKDRWPTNLLEMASRDPSGRLQKYYRKVRKTGPKCRTGLIAWKWCKIRQKDCINQLQTLGGLSESAVILVAMTTRMG